MDLISVIIPARNAEAYLHDAIESVLGQNWPNLEVLVVDNGSSDGTLAVARSFGPPVVCLTSERPGQPPTTNHGVRHAQGDWLAFVDADDLWAPGKLQRQFRAFEEEPGLDAVFCHVVNFTGRPPNSETEIGPGLPAPVPGTVLIRREAFLRVGYFDENYVLGSIMDWYMRAQDAGLRIRMLPAVLLYRRIHEDNLGKRQKNQQGDYVAIVKAALDR